MAQGKVKCLALGFLSLGLSSCFYDSRWGQQKQSEQHAAARSTPQQLRSQALNREGRVADRTLRLRVYATPAYAATVLDWQKQFEALLDCANSVFVPDFGTAFEAVELKSFRPKAGEAKLDEVLAELRQEDEGRDVDWVVGLVTAVPSFAVSADDLGVAPLLGKHLVMRAMSDAHEYEAITRELSELSESERLKLYQVRKRHKLCAVFLHEVAHTLGVPHELVASSLMNPRYQVGAQGFSDEASRILRASLELRATQPSLLLDAKLAGELSSWLQASNADWEPNTRDELLGEFSSAGNSSIPASTTATATDPSGEEPPPSPAPSGPPIEGLSSAEQQRYDSARAELNAGRAARARQLAAPLLAKYAKLPAIMSLRCDIAMGIGGDWETISAECPGYSSFGSDK
jgi:hypothetical protein